MLICGLICAVTQALVEIKIPFPVVAWILMALVGGLLTYTGTVTWLNTLGPGGPAVTAVGCGNGAYCI